MLDIPHRLNNRLYERHVSVPVLFLLYIGPFLKHGNPCGKDYICILRHLGCIGGDMGKERQLLHRFFPSLRACAGEGEVIHITDSHFDFIRIFLQHTGSDVIRDRTAAGFAPVKGR